MATNAACVRTGDITPPLNAGDRLSREEFERRYGRMPHVKKAELVEGVVYMPSPVSDERHGVPHADFMTWLGVYRTHTSGVEAADNSTVRLDWDNEPQPDATLRVRPECGGQSRDEDGYVTLAPEWVGEISATSASYDLHDKKEAYRRNGVREYVVWQVDDGAIDWFALRGGRYERIEPDDHGIYRSEIFPGLWLDASDLLSGNMAGMLAVLQQGLDSAAHAEFCSELTQRRKTSAESTT